MKKIKKTNSHASQTGTVSYSDLLEKASGKLPYKLTNDYLFHATLLENNNVLKALLCSLLDLEMEDVSSVTITNPVEYGESAEAKEFILDIRVIMNDSAIINLEMQVINKGDWPERSLCYLCRSFDSLNKGEDYLSLNPAIHIGILDFTLFPQYPEFYSSYLMMNKKNHTVYSDKLCLYVLNLPQIHLATETDRACQLDNWAALLKATTWEEIRMTATKNQYMQEAAETMYRLSQNEKIRLQCEARERYYRDQKTTQHRLEQLKVKEATILEMEKTILEKEDTILEMDAEIQEREDTIQKKNAEIQQREDTIQKKNAEIQQREDTIQKKNAEIQQREDTIQKKSAEIQQKDAEIQEKDAEIQEKDAEIQERDAKIQEKDAEIQEKDAEIARLRAALKNQ